VEREQVLFRLFGKYCPEGTILFTEGSPGQELFFIQSGSVRLGAARAERGHTSLLGPGDLLGEGSFFARSPRTTRAEVVQDARLIQVNDRTLDAVVRHGPETAAVIFEQLLRLTKSAAGELTLWTVEHLLRRCAPLLLESAAAGILPGTLAEHASVLEADALVVLEELRRRGALVREGERYRAADAAVLQREIDAIAAAGSQA
jgi:CRP-like cAMP-binding protein